MAFKLGPGLTNVEVNVTPASSCPPNPGLKIYHGSFSSVDAATTNKSQFCYPEDPHANVLYLLTVAQELHIDFLPFSYQPGLEVIGAGGTSKLRQSRINLQTSFAFKQLENSLNDMQASVLDEAKAFRALIAEVSLLNNAAIRGHPHVIKLEGISWEISKDEEKLRPVLVFEKSRYADMRKVLRSEEGKTIKVSTPTSTWSDPLS